MTEPLLGPTIVFYHPYPSYFWWTTWCPSTIHTNHTHIPTSWHKCQMQTNDDENNRQFMCSGWPVCYSNLSTWLMMRWHPRLESHILCWFTHCLFMSLWVLDVIFGQAPWALECCLKKKRDGRHKMFFFLLTMVLWLVHSFCFLCNTISHAVYCSQNGNFSNV